MSHPTKRCGTCEFWDRQDQWGGSDVIGNCHRNAPRPTMGDFEHETLRHLTHISWTHVSDEEKEKEFDNWEEAELQEVTWPTTAVSDWCGEWQQRTRMDSP